MFEGHQPSENEMIMLKMKVKKKICVSIFNIQYEAL